MHQGSTGTPLKPIIVVFFQITAGGKIKTGRLPAESEYWPIISFKGSLKKIGFFLFFLPDIIATLVLKVPISKTGYFIELFFGCIL